MWNLGERSGLKGVLRVICKWKVFPGPGLEYSESLRKGLRSDGRRAAGQGGG